MQYLTKYKEENLLFFDIETVRATNEYPEGQLKDAWEYKARYQNEINRKTGVVMTPEEYYIDKAALYAPFAKIAVICAGKIRDNQIRVKTYMGVESQMLAEFNSDLRIAGKIVLAGFNNIGFDQPFVLKRMVVNGVAPCGLLDTAHLKPWEVDCVDLSRLWQSTSYYPDSLVAVATALGIPSPKDALDGSKVSEYYYAGKINSIADYCKADVIATANIYRKMLGKPLV